MTSHSDALMTEIQTFARETVAPLAAAWSFGEAPSQTLLEAAAKLGLTSIQVPEEFGGRGLDFAYKTKACEALAAFDFGLSMSLVNTQNVARKIALMAPKPIAQKFLPGLLDGKVTACTALTEPGAGSDFAAITTRATRQAGGWELNGEKAWIINGRHAGVSVVFAKCEDPDHGVQPVGGASIGAFLVDLNAPGVRRYAIDSSFSQTSMGTGGFVLSGVTLPSDHLLLAPGSAFKSALSEINGARTYVAAMCCAMLRAGLDEVSAYGARRSSFGKPLAAHQAWRHDVVKVQTDLAAARALTDEAIELVSSGGDAQLAAAQAKIQAVEACQRGLPVLLHAMGAEGLRTDYCFTRHLGASQVAAFTDGSTAMLRERVARLQPALS